MGTNNIPTSNHKYWFEIFIFFREYNRQYYEPAYLLSRVHSEVFKHVIIQLQFLLDLHKLIFVLAQEYTIAIHWSYFIINILQYTYIQ